MSGSTIWQSKCIISFLVSTAMILNWSLSTAQNDSDVLIPKYLWRAPKLNRAHRNKILVHAECGKFCEYLTWEIKSPEDRNWRSADFDDHSKGRSDLFYIRGLNADTDYSLRALVRPRNGGPPYAAEDVPTLDTRTCPDTPPAVTDLHVYSAGPREIEIRWKENKERCKSFLYYEVRYAISRKVFSPWKSYGTNVTNNYTYFYPTHPCSVWPEEFCLILAVGVDTGEQIIVQVRVVRYDGDPGERSLPSNVTVQAYVDLVANTGCPTMGVVPTTVTSIVTSTVATTAPPLLTERNATQSSPPLSTPVTRASGDGTSQEMCDGDSTVCHLSPLFWTLLIITCCSIPAAFLLGKRYRKRGTVELQMVSAREQLCGGDEGLLAHDMDEN